LAPERFGAPCWIVSSGFGAGPGCSTWFCLPQWGQSIWGNPLELSKSNGWRQNWQLTLTNMADLPAPGSA
jgi:hypothetical protein